MKALRWILILVNGLDIDGSNEISFIGKLIEGKNLGINFEDLSYIHYTELANSDNIFNVEIVSGILTTTIPAPENAIQSEEKSLFFIEERYRGLFENKEYEIAFDRFQEDSVSGCIIYLSPNEPSMTARNMVQQVKGGHKKKLPPIERDMSNITSRISTTENPTEWNSFVEDIDQKISDNIENAPTPGAIKQISDFSENTKTSIQPLLDGSDNQEDWNSFIGDIAPQKTQKTSSSPLLEESDNQEDWNSFIGDIAPQKTEKTSSPPLLEKSSDNNEDWNSFIGDIAPQKTAQTASAPHSPVNKSSDNNEDWNSFIGDIAPQKTAQTASAPHSPVNKSSDNSEDWNSFIGDIAPQKTAQTASAPHSPVNKADDKKQAWNSFVNEISSTSAPTKRVSIEDNASPKDWDLLLGNTDDSGDTDMKQEAQKSFTHTFKPINTARRPSAKTEIDEFDRNNTSFKSSPTKRLNIPNLDNIPVEKKDGAEWGNFMENLVEEKSPKSPTIPPEKNASSEEFPKVFAKSSIFFENKSETKSSTAFPKANIEKKSTKEKKASLSPTPVPFTTGPKVPITKTYQEIRPEQNRVPTSQPKMDVMFDDMPKKITKPKKAKASIFKRLVYFIFFIIFVAAGTFAYLWFEHRTIAEEIITEAEKYILIAKEKIWPQDDQQKAQLNSFTIAIEKSTDYYQNLINLKKFTTQNGNSSALQKLKENQVAKTIEYLQKEVEQLQSISHFTTTKSLLKKYSQLDDLASECQNLEKKLNEYANAATEKMITYAQNAAANEKFTDALAIINNSNEELLPEMTQKLLDSKKNMLNLFIKKYSSEKTFNNGITALAKFLQEKHEHDLFRTEFYLLQLIHKQVITYTRVFKYDNAIKELDKYKTLALSIQGNIHKLKLDTQAESEVWDILVNGLKRLASTKKEYSLEVIGKDNKEISVKGRLLVSGKSLKAGIIAIRANSKNNPVSIFDLSTDTLANIAKTGMRMNIPTEERYYKLAIILLTQQKYESAKVAFEKANKKDVFEEKIIFFKE